jgi:hypothetical protein
MKKKLSHHKSSTDPLDCPQGPGETWRYWYNNDYLIVVTVEEASDLHYKDGWRCLVLHGGCWKYEPGIILDWAIHAIYDGSWEKVL